MILHPINDMEREAVLAQEEAADVAGRARAYLNIDLPTAAYLQARAAELAAEAQHFLDCLLS